MEAQDEAIITTGWDYRRAKAIGLLMDWAWNAAIIGDAIGVGANRGIDLDLSVPLDDKGHL